MPEKQTQRKSAKRLMAADEIGPLTLRLSHAKVVANELADGLYRITVQDATLENPGANGRENEETAGRVQVVFDEESKQPHLVIHASPNQRIATTGLSSEDRIRLSQASPDDLAAVLANSSEETKAKLLAMLGMPAGQQNNANTKNPNEKQVDK